MRPSPKPPIKEPQPRSADLHPERARRRPRQPGVNPTPAQKEKSLLGPRDLVLLALLLIAPFAALQRLAQQFDITYLLPAIALIQCFAYLSIWLDKNRAIYKRWRIPEDTLHLWELLGGWPAGFLAQRQYRHKTSKLRYQAVFWLVVAIHQYLALDYSLNWWIIRSLAAGVVKLFH